MKKFKSLALFNILLMVDDSEPPRKYDDELTQFDCDDFESTD